MSGTPPQRPGSAGPATPVAGASTRPANDPAKIFGTIPYLIARARRNELTPQATAQLRAFLTHHRAGILAHFASANLPNPYTDLPPSVDPSVPLGSAGTSSTAPSPASSAATSAMTPAPSPPATTVQTSMSAPASAPVSAPPSKAGPPALAPRPAPTPSATPASSSTPANKPPSYTWAQIFKMTPQERAGWFKTVPGSEKAFNEIMEKAKASAAAQQAAAKQQQQQQQQQSAQAKSAGPLPNLAIPANRAKPPAPTPAIAPPPPPPPAPAFSLDADKIKHYASLNEAQGNALPPAEKAAWMRVKNFIMQQKRAQQASQAVQAQTAATAATAAVITDPSNVHVPPPAPDNGRIMSQQALMAEIERLKRQPGGMTMQMLKGVCARAGQAWTPELELKLAQFAVDGQHLLRRARTPSPPPKTSREILEGNAAAMYEDVTGEELDDWTRDVSRRALTVAVDADVAHSSGQT